MVDQIAATDPVLAIRARIEAIHDAMEAATSRTAERKISNALPALWAEYGKVKPITPEGAAAGLRQAEDYEPELYASNPPFAIFPVPGQLGKIADRIEAGAFTRRDIEIVSALAQSAVSALGGKHVMARLLTNVAAYLKGRMV